MEERKKDSQLLRVDEGDERKSGHQFRHWNTKSERTNEGLATTWKLWHWTQKHADHRDFCEKYLFFLCLYSLASLTLESYYYIVRWGFFFCVFAKWPTFKFTFASFSTARSAREFIDLSQWRCDVLLYNSTQTQKKSLYIEISSPGVKLNLFWNFRWN